MKPSNILVDEDFGGHVGDFGVAKLLGEEETMRITQTLATIGYMAPGTFPNSLSFMFTFRLCLFQEESTEERKMLRKIIFLYLVLP